MFTPIFKALWRAMNRPEDWSIVLAYPGVPYAHDKVAALHARTETYWLINKGFVFELQGELDGLRDWERYLLAAKLRYKVLHAIERREAEAQAQRTWAAEELAAAKLKKMFEENRRERVVHLHRVK